MNRIMRFLVRAQIPTEAGNKMIKNPKFMQNLEEEPLFQDIGAKVEFHPVMVFEDLKKAMGHLG